MTRTSLRFFFSCNVFDEFWYENSLRPIQCIWKCSFLSNFLEGSRQNWCYFFLKCVGQFTTEAIWTLSFLGGKFLSYNCILADIVCSSNLSHCEGTFVVCVFQGTRLLNLQTQSYLWYPPYYPLNSYRICNEITFFIADIGYLCLFSFSQSVWQDVYQLYWWRSQRVLF